MRQTSIFGFGAKGFESVNELGYMLSVHISGAVGQERITTAKKEAGFKEDLSDGQSARGLAWQTKIRKDLLKSKKSRLGSVSLVVRCGACCVIACPRTKNKIRAPLEGTVSPAEDDICFPFTGSGHPLSSLRFPHLFFCI